MNILFGLILIFVGLAILGRGHQGYEERKWGDVIACLIMGLGALYGAYVVIVEGSFSPFYFGSGQGIPRLGN
jgi:hypothetical protein